MNSQRAVIHRTESIVCLILSYASEKEITKLQSLCQLFYHRMIASVQTSLVVSNDFDVYFLNSFGAKAYLRLLDIHSNSFRKFKLRY